MSQSDNYESGLIPVGSAGLAKVQNALRLTDNLVNSFDSVVIGEQKWMLRNLNVSRFRNGDIIPEMRDNDEWIKAGREGRPAWCYFDNDPENGKIYGKLYNWYAASNLRGIAPVGWTVPSQEDWGKLVHELGGERIAGGKMKMDGLKYWHHPNADATNSSGFRGLPAGDRIPEKFNGDTTMAYWWSKTESSLLTAFSSFLLCDHGRVEKHSLLKGLGLSIRCIKIQENG